MIITEERRQQLIADTKAEIAHLERCCERYDAIGSADALEVCQSNLERQQIVLMVLEAKPVEYLTWHQGCRAPDDCEDYTIFSRKGDKSCDGSNAFPVYTAPPVPVLKPIERPETRAIGWAKWVAQDQDDMWVENIRAAGYEVKE